MKPTSKKFVTSAAMVLTSAFLAMTISTAHAANYCITSGAQDAHGCGYPTMEACRAASSGLGGICAAAPSYNDPNAAMAFEPKQPHARSTPRHRKESTWH